jgi:metacaspase-1
MAQKGYAVHIGLNRVDPNKYEGWSGDLQGCENDVASMKGISKQQGFSTIDVLTTQNATHAHAKSAIEKAAGALRTGDLFFLTYSGHGGQVPDTNGDETEDGKDETWVLYDEELIDDELYALWSKFEQGVRIIVLSDSCHSGTVTREPPPGSTGFGPPREVPAEESRHESVGRVKVMPAAVMARMQSNKTHRDYYEKVQREHPQGSRVAIGASVVLVSGCQDNQTSADGAHNGLFTESLLKVWAAGKFKGAYQPFQKAIARVMPVTQSPNYFVVGMPNPAFERQRPFTI